MSGTALDPVVMDFEPKVMKLTLGDEDRSHLEVRVGRSFFLSGMYP
jgi:hypothetical protein